MNEFLSWFLLALAIPMVISAILVCVHLKYMKRAIIYFKHIENETNRMLVADHNPDIEEALLDAMTKGTGAISLAGHHPNIQARYVDLLGLYLNLYYCVDYTVRYSKWYRLVTTIPPHHMKKILFP